MMQERFGSGRHNWIEHAHVGFVAPSTCSASTLLEVSTPHRSGREDIAIAWAAVFAEAMGSLDDKVTDYLAVVQSSMHRLPSTYKVTVYYEGRASIDEVTSVFRAALPKLAACCCPLVITLLRDATLRRCRQENSRRNDLGSFVELNEHWVQGLRYRVPLEAVVHSRLGWQPAGDSHPAG